MKLRCPWPGMEPVSDHPWVFVELSSPSTGPLKSTVHLRANNGQYVCAEGGGGGAVVANRTLAKEWETFQLIGPSGSPLRSGDLVSLQSYNNQFVCAEGSGGGVVNANRNAIGPWETFTIQHADGSSGEISNGQQVALRVDNGQFLCAEDGGGRELIANRTALGPWETFTIEIL